MSEPVISPTPGTPAAPASGSPPATPAPDSAPQSPPAATTPGAPASGTPPPAEGQPAAATPPGTPPDSGARPGEDATTLEKRLKDTQAALTRANQAKSTLSKTLEGLGIVPPAAGAPAAPAPPAQAPPAPAAGQPPAAGAPPAPQRWEIDPAVKKELFAKYQGATSDEEAFGVLLEEATNLLMQQLPGLLEDRLIAAVMSDKDARVFKGTEKYLTEQAKANKQMADGITAIEKFWGEAVPGIPLELCWTFSKQAQLKHPGDLAEQAYYCLTKAIERLGPLVRGAAESATITEGIQRGQGAILPGTTGAPAAGGGERATSFADQLKQANRGT